MAAAGAVLLSAFLLFMVQPLMGRLITPWFGGSAAVWTACLAFFQTALVIGYGYAALSLRLLAPRLQRLLHLGLLAASLLFLPIQPSIVRTPTAPHDPLGEIVLVLLTSAGLPYMLLAATGPLAQAWLAGASTTGPSTTGPSTTGPSTTGPSTTGPSTTRTARVPWRLFALSNAASIAALLAYPVAVEPWLPLRAQAWAWSIFYGLAVLMTAVLAWQTRAPLAAPSPVAATAHAHDGLRDGLRNRAAWLLLAAVPTAMLVATTEYLTRNVAPIPLLWIPPLALYLLSFVVWFDGRLPFHRLFWVLATTAAVLVMARVMTLISFRFESALLMPVFFAGLFTLCLYCHGELARRRPSLNALGAYYFTIALGGALGGLAVALLAPLVLDAHYDVAIVLAASALPLALAAGSFTRPLLKSMCLACAVLALAAGLYGVRNVYRADRDDLVSQQRNFYGTLSVVELDRGTPEHRRELHHGLILHSLQYLAPARRHEPTIYYQPEAAAGLAIATLPERPRRIGVIGLGAGTIAAYGRPGDEIVFYEIDPAVERIARRDFTFLADSRATITIVPGDARLSLEREPARHYDLLVLDAFSGNAPPLHLLTVEAFATYLRHVTPEGLIAVQVSHKFLTFDPLVLASLGTFGWTGAAVTDEGMSEWIVAARDRARLRVPPLGRALKPDAPVEVRPWTDDFIDILRVVWR